MSASTPTVQDGSFLTLHYRLSGPDGADVVNTFDGTPATLSIGSGELSPGIEARLIGLAEGTHTTLALAPEEAFGPRNPELMQRVSMALLRKHGDLDATYSVGDVVQFPGPEGQGGFVGVLRELGPGGDDWAVFDFNHPLAGVALNFEVRIIGVL
ncbi:MAG: peptidylprolyl isomerase [Aquabacterium sp.]|jgi:FKBP-type peptidyl-prolyl cis-trans isomerase SlpA|nr:MAG: peptidylprolyl isomerase [Aquabacterium sp.]